jgi:hypothetical protein
MPPWDPEDLDEPPWCPSAPPCWPLLADPAAVLGDRRRWPRHLCEALLRASVEGWLLAHPARLPGGSAELLALGDEWPLPLLPLRATALAGQALPPPPPLPPDLDWRVDAADADPGPPPDDALGGLGLVRDAAGRLAVPPALALALAVPLPSGTLDLWGVAVPDIPPAVPAGTPARHLLPPAYRLGELLVAVHGPPAALGAARPLVEGARRWWRRWLLGERLGGGRPPGPLAYDRAAWPRVAREMQRLRRAGVSWRGIGRRFGVDASTAWRWVRLLAARERPVPPAAD